MLSNSDNLQPVQIPITIKDNQPPKNILEMIDNETIKGTDQTLKQSQSLGANIDVP